MILLEVSYKATGSACFDFSAVQISMPLGSQDYVNKTAYSMIWEFRHPENLIARNLLVSIALSLRL